MHWLNKYYGSLLAAVVALSVALALALWAAGATAQHAGLAAALTMLAALCLAFAATRLPLSHSAAPADVPAPADGVASAVRGPADSLPAATGALLSDTLKEERLRETLEQRTRMLQATNHDLEARVRELNILFSASRALGSSLERGELLGAFTEATWSLLNVDRFAILVQDPRRGALSVSETMGFESTSAFVRGMTVPSASYLESQVFLRRKPILIHDLESETRSLLLKERGQVQGAALIIPLLAGSRAVGIWVLQRNPPRTFSFDDSGIYHAVANQLATALENARLYQMTRDLATHDELTGLYNRRTLDSRTEMEWERAKRFGAWLGLIMVDVDHFKDFNDTYGHLMGDQVLRHVGNLLQNGVRNVDMVARFGGEEFCVILPRASLDEARTVAEKLRRLVESTPLVDESGTFAVTASFGVASSEIPVSDIRELLDMSDQALYRAKAEGRNRVGCATPPEPSMLPLPQENTDLPITRGPHINY